MRAPLPRILTLALAMALASPALADDVSSAGGGGVPADPVAMALQGIAAQPFHDPAPLWSHRDARLQGGVERALRHLGLDRLAAQGRLGVALVDVTDTTHPRVAEVNGDRMIYAASLPKIAILLGIFEKIQAGRLRLDARLEDQLDRMISDSSNTAATALLHRVGKADLARMLIGHYRLYDPRRGGGLWVGKDYASQGLWRRDPLHNLSHGATAMQVARFYYLLDTGQLVSPAASRKMKKILGGTRIEHKFAKALHRLHPDAHLYRKSGTWGGYHADSALVEQDGRSYILVALAETPPHGSDTLGEILGALDPLIPAAPRM